MMPLFDVILIETHNACTRACWFCKFGQERQDVGPAEMKWSTIKRIVFNLRDLDYRGRISWFWINEPLMDPRIVNIVRFTRKHCPNAFISLVTNGDLLTDDIFADLRANGLDALGVSIYDTPAAEQVGKLRTDDRLVLMDMRKIAPRSLENRGGNIVRQAKVFAGDQQARLTTSCGRPFKMMTVNARGEAVLCCSDLYSDVVMGDLETYRLEEIWNNDLFRHYRAQLDEKGRAGLKLCGDCSYNGGPSPLRYPLREPLNA